MTVWANIYSLNLDVQFRSALISRGWGSLYRPLLLYKVNREAKSQTKQPRQPLSYAICQNISTYTRLLDLESKYDFGNNKVPKQSPDLNHLYRGISKKQAENIHKTEFFSSISRQEEVLCTLSRCKVGQPFCYQSQSSPGFYPTAYCASHICNPFNAIPSKKKNEVGTDIHKKIKIIIILFYTRLDNYLYNKKVEV